MKTNTSPVLPGEVQEYVHLQRQIHDALRKEHPEWVEPNGELDNVEERRVLTALEVIYEGGCLHGKTVDFPTRDLERVVVGLHVRNWHFFETYKRTICVDIRSQRTIFRCAGTFKPNNSSWWERLLAVLRIRKVKAIVI